MHGNIKASEAKVAKGAPSLRKKSTVLNRFLALTENAFAEWEDE